jgi:Glycosyltransferase sugar-binding region containing DXD motif
VTIHRYWTGTPPTGDAWLRTALHSMNPGATFRDWTDATLPAAVLEWLDAHDADVEPKDRAIHRSNLVRYWALDKYGGWWVDHDVIMLTPFDHLPSPLAAWQVDRVASCVLGLPPQHPWLRAALRGIEKWRGVGPVGDVSGERLLERLRVDYAPEVTLKALPFDAFGAKTGAEPWAIHLFRLAGERVAR